MTVARLVRPLGTLGARPRSLVQGDGPFAHWPSPRPGAAPHWPGGESMRVLLVEDEPLAMQRAKTLLARFGSFPDGFH